MQEEEEGAVIDSGQARAEAPPETLFLMFAPDNLCLGFPLYAERGIGQHIIELVVLEMVIGKAVAEGDMLDGLSLDHHIGPADGVGLGVIVLAEYLQQGVGVQFPKILLGHG